MTAAELLDVRDLVIGRSEDDGIIVSGIDLTIAPGESVAVVGESGSGKSLTARSILGLLPEGLTVQGSVRFKGTDLFELRSKKMNRIRGAQIGFVMQDPFTMLNPLMRVEEHLVDGLRAPEWRKASKAEKSLEARRRLAEVGINRPGVERQYPFELSGGMRQRVGIAAALAQDPTLLIADEPTTALDVTIQKEILELIKSLQVARNMSLLLVTHDLSVAFTVADRIYVMYAGSVLETATPKDIVEQPMHPYSRGLLLSEPPIHHRSRQLVGMPGSVPDPDKVRDMCLFAPRCQWARDVCHDGKPPLLHVGHSRFTACRRIDEIRGELRIESSGPTVSLSRSSAPTHASVLSVENLTKVFTKGRGKRLQRVEALTEASLEIYSGESVGLVGESGSGKTTLGRCLVGLETPTSGRIVFAARDISQYQLMSQEERRWVHRQIQIVFQDPYSSLNPARSIGSTLREAIGFNDQVENPETEVRELLERVGLPPHFVGRRPSGLSGGERQRVAIARAIATRPKLLVCDEPVSALDVSVQAQILELFRSLEHDLGIQYLFVTHDLAVVRQIVDRLYVLYKGRVVESGSVDQVLDDPQDDYTQRLVESIPTHS